jgi:hypothetical protein
MTTLCLSFSIHFSQETCMLAWKSARRLALYAEQRLTGKFLTLADWNRVRHIIARDEFTPHQIYDRARNVMIGTNEVRSDVAPIALSR